MCDHSEQLQLLLQRRKLLDCISKGARVRREIASQTSDSRSTVYRALRELTEAGLLQEHRGRYELTNTGALLFERMSDLYAMAQTLDDIEGRGLPTSGSKLDPSIFVDSQITRAERHAPYRPLNPVKKLLKQSEQVFGFTPTLFPEFVSELEGPDRTDIELIIENGSVQRLDDDEAFREMFVRTFRSVERIGVTDSQLPFVLFVATTPVTRLCVVLIDEGVPNVTIENRTERANEWALDLYHRYRRRDAPIDERQFGSVAIENLV